MGVVKRKRGVIEVVISSKQAVITKMFHVNLMVTTKQKPIVDKQKKKKKMRERNHRSTKEDSQRAKKEQWSTKSQKIINRMATIGS